MNEAHQAGTQGLEYTAENGLAVVAVEPLLGGKLVDPPAPITDLWSTADRQRTPVEWAMDWLWHKPQVSVVLSGMSAMDHVKKNVIAAEGSSTGMLSEEELALVSRVRDRYDELCPVPCTQCGYCMPCPNGVNIPRSFSLFNTGVMYEEFSEARHGYARMQEESRASACIQCRECGEKCPQSIVISEWMPLMHEVLGKGRLYQDCVLPGQGRARRLLCLQAPCIALALGNCAAVPSLAIDYGVSSTASSPVSSPSASVAHPWRRAYSAAWVRLLTCSFW